ncbi:MATE family efflux transporter [Pseudoalteromonas sp. MMG012]|uniref:MATE family efflux transporter n=1 Tax=Pseudoalteromonas sp. MMG012 TaxID=2822686 RepID=UPI001B3A37E0|nr:MATE family efflux transporter [Pseudoalteromonas sp. MMG012]MBQ4852424.1 MATE family efflux transporter [Pseudoalteromonas sp. MMG012]
MQDLTRGPIHKHLITMSLPIAIGLFIQTLYFIIDLYFVGNLGDVALAGVSTAGNLFFFVMALTQVFNVGCATLVAHAIGRKDQKNAAAIYSHALFYGIAATILLSAIGYLFGPYYFSLLAATNDIAVTGLSYLYWFIPALALQFILTVISASMRGAGLVKPFMVIQMVALLLNMVLSPVLITGIGLFSGMHVAGAGLASSIATISGLIMTIFYIKHTPGLLKLAPNLIKNDTKTLKSLLKIGGPAGSEFMLTFLYMAIIYWALSQLGTDEQAGFGLGIRIMQSLFLPVMAIAFAAPAIAAQNYAAGKMKRVYTTYKTTTLATTSLMFLLAIPCILMPEIFFTPFSNDPEVIAVAATFLSYVGFNFVPAGLVFSCSAMFQAFGNTWPALLSTFLRVGSFSILLVYFTSQATITTTTIWLLSAATVFFQALISFTFLQLTLKRRLFSKVKILT